MASCTFTGNYSRDPRGPKFKDGGPKNAGPDGWKFLHLSALDGKLSNQVIQDFAKCIDCPDCKRHFLQLIQDRPVPPDADADEQFEITVDLHNEVNLRRNVSAIPLADARKLWESEGEAADPGTKKSLKADRPATGGMRIAIMISQGSSPDVEVVQKEQQEDDGQD